MKSSFLESRRPLAWLGGVLGIVLVAATVAVAVSVRGHSHPSLLPKPSSTGPPLFMFRQPAPMIDFYTWDGKLVRRLMTALPVVASADGRLYIDSDGRIYETQGKQVGIVADWQRLSFAQWADDSAHICGIISDNDGGRALEVVGIRGAPKRYPLQSVTQYARVAACSFRCGRAAIWDGGLQVLSLGDGKTMKTIPPPPGEHDAIIGVSQDVRWLLRTIFLPTGDFRTEVVDLEDESIKATYQDLSAGAVSPDDRLLVVGVFPSNNETRVLDWRTGQVVWSRTTSLGLAEVAAISDAATNLLLVELHTDDPNAFHYREYWIIDGQGHARPFHPVP